jgi:WD40 repeat protein/serine/threonine protein kinase
MEDANSEMLSLFEGAVDRAAPEERAAFLDQACGDNAELRRRIEALLRAHDQAGGFLLDRSPADNLVWTHRDPITELPGTVVGPYKLLEQIGEGGFGVVFMAEQQQPIRRKVALKVVKPGMDTKQVIARFEAERQALALMDHPHIARVFDGGATTAGRPYFVMELVRGIPITDYCDQNHLPVRQRLDLFVSVCQAVQHAHQKGIIHRDLKPSNVLVAEYDEKPMAKVIDFGVAKATGQQLTERTMFTGFGQFVGTLEYMSPEQAKLNALDIDTRSDIYALGVLLYELLTGTTPFDKKRLHQAAFDEVLRIIREEDPPKPSTRISTLAQAATTVSTNRKSDPRRLSQSFRGELDWIIMRCLEKDRNRRYETAIGLARDIQRYLHDEPVQACPPSWRYRFGKFVRKHGKLLATAAAFALLLIMLALGAAVSAWQLAAEKDATSQQLQETLNAQGQTKLELYQSLVAQARANRLSRRSGRRVRSLEILTEASRLARELQLPDDEVRNETIACLPLVDLTLAKTWDLYLAAVASLEFDGNLERYARYDPLKNVASVRRVLDDSELFRIAEFSQNKDAVGVALSGQFLVRKDNSTYTVWRMAGGRTELLLQVPGRNMRFSPDSRRLAVARQDKRISVYDLPSGKESNQLQCDPLHFGRCGLAFHPYQPQLAVIDGGAITVFDLNTGSKISGFAATPEDYRLEWHPDGKRLAYPGVDTCIHVWDAYTGKHLDRLAGHSQGYIRFAFHPAGDLMASMSWDGTLRVWDLATGQELFKTHWGVDQTLPLRFSPDGRLLAADFADQQLRLWEFIPPCGYRSLVQQPNLGKTVFNSCAASSRRPLLAVGTEEGVGLWDSSGGRPLAHLAVGPYHGVAFEPSGALLTFGYGLQLRWPIEAIGPKGALRIGPPQRLPFPPSAYDVATSLDGRVMASAQGRGALVSFTGKGNELIWLGPQHDVRFIAVSPEGKWVASGSHSSTDVYVKIWEGRTGRHVTDLPVEGSSLVEFSGDGRWLVTTGGGIRMWEVGSWREKPKITGTTGGFAFSPDSKVLAVESGFGAIRLLDPESGREYARLEDPNQCRAENLAFNSDGSLLFASTKDRPAVHSWDLRAIRTELAGRGLDWDLPPHPPLAETKNPSSLQVMVDLGDFNPITKEKAEQALELNNQAWPLAAHPDPIRRDPARAVTLAKKAIGLCPQEPQLWNTLGVAQYRTGDWRAAIEALTRSMKLQYGNLESFDTFFLAMAHWRLGEMDKAREYYDRAVRWMEQNKDHLGDNADWAEELRRFRAEAEELLGVNKK